VFPKVNARAEPVVIVVACFKFITTDQSITYEVLMYFTNPTNPDVKPFKVFSDRAAYQRGSIEAESAGPGQGATFRMRLPAAAAGELPGEAGSVIIGV